MKSLWMVAVLGLVGCANVSPALPFIDATPAGAVQSDDSLARQLWVAAGLDEPNESCVAPLWVHVDAATFQTLCEHDENAAWGCTRWMDETHAVSVWSGDGDEQSVLLHEQLHVLENCVLGDADADHTNRVVWTAGYPNPSLRPISKPTTN